MLEIKIKRGRVEVKSEVLKKHPLLALPIQGPTQGVKIRSVYIPENRPSINEWFNKHF